MPLIQARSQKEAKVLFLVIGTAFIVNFVVLLMSLVTGEYITTIWCAFATVVAMIVTMQLRPQAFTDILKSQEYK